MLVTFKDRIKKTSDMTLFAVPTTERWGPITSRPMSILFKPIFPLGVRNPKRYKEKIGYEQTFNSLYINNDIYYDFSRLDEEQEKISAMLQQEPDFMQRVAQQCEEEGEKLLKETRRFAQKDFANKTTKELENIFETNYQHLIDFAIYLLFPLAIQKRLEIL